MSPFVPDETRQPLSPVIAPNVLSDAMPPVLELQEVFKGENAEGDVPLPTRTASRSTPTPTTLPDSADSDSPVSEPSVAVVTPIQVPPEFLDKSGHMLAGPATTETSTTMSPDSERDWGSRLPLKGDDGLQRDGRLSVVDTPPALGSEDGAEDEDATRESEEAEDAVMALLSLQRNPSVADLQHSSSTSELSRISSTADFSSGGTTSPREERVGEKRRAPSPFGGDYASGARHSPVPKFASEPGESRYFCRYPHCGKGYASTDAVRKHCRQRHLEWLRRLGHGCPALYCRWSVGDSVSAP